jgi:hypothetical protein
MDMTDFQATLVRKLRRQTSILSDAEVALLTSIAVKRLEESFGDNPYCNAQSMEDIIRWSALRARCEQERKKRGLSLKDVSLRLKIPQYRLRAIEYGELAAFQPEMAREYFGFLGIEHWVARWRKANREMAERAGLTPLTAERRKCVKR